MKTKHIALIIAFAVLLIALGIQSNRVERQKTRYSQLELTFNAYRLEQASKIIALETSWLKKFEYNQIESKRREDETKADNEMATATALNDANRLYSKDIARLRASCNTTHANGGEATGDPIGVLAYVLTRADERAGALARIADERRNAGLACEAAYDVVRTARSKDKKKPEIESYSHRGNIKQNKPTLK